MAIKLTDCLIGSIGMAAGADFPCEIFQLNYGKIQWTYTRQNRQGGVAAGNTAAGWDRRKNRAA